MAAFKLVTVIGIHPKEYFLDTDAAANTAWSEAVTHPSFVAAALFKGGHTAPLSGQSFAVVRALARDID